MEPIQKTKLESPAWQQPAAGNERNDAIKTTANETIKPGGNARSAEDDLDLDKQPYQKDNVEEQKPDVNEDPDEQSF